MLNDGMQIRLDSLRKQQIRKACRGEANEELKQSSEYCFNDISVKFFVVNELLLYYCALVSYDDLIGPLQASFSITQVYHCPVCLFQEHTEELESHVCHRNLLLTAKRHLLDEVGCASSI